MDFDLEKLDQADTEMQTSVRHIGIYIANLLWRMKMDIFRKNSVLRDTTPDAWLTQYPLPQPFDNNFNVNALYLQNQAFYYGMFQYRLQALQSYNALVELYDAHPSILEDEDWWMNYSYTLIGGFGSAAQLQLHKEFDFYSLRLQQLEQQKKLPDLSKLIFLHLQQYFFIATGQFERGLPVVEKMEVFFAEAPKIPPRTMQIALAQLSAGIIYVGLSQWDKALHYLAQAEQSAKQSSKILYSTARLLTLLVYYEKEEFLLLPYSIRSTYRALLKDQDLFEFERLFLRALRRLSQAANQTEKDKTMHLLYKKLSKFKDDIVKLEPQLYFNYLAWVKSKIQKCSMAAVLQQKMD